MSKAVFNGLVKFIDGLTIGIFLGIALMMWALDKFRLLDYKELDRFWIRADKNKKAD